MLSFRIRRFLPDGAVFFSRENESRFTDLERELAEETENISAECTGAIERAIARDADIWRDFAA